MSHRGRVTTVPPHASPIVKTLFQEMRDSGVTYEQLARRSGLSPYSIWSWRGERVPLITNIVAALNAVGLDLVVVRRRRGNEAQAAE